jgi:uncharacterized membrane protein
MLTGPVGFAGMAIDAGYMQWNKRRLQLAADAAAMGALRELEQKRPTNVAAAGINDAALNGFVNGQDHTTVTVQNPPAAGAYAGNPLAVRAVVQRQFPTLFMRIFGQNNVTISASAVAHTSTSVGNIGG